ncbi:hypothetical protein TSUD_226300 [Trifolium subterraneum]|uniref:Uncharacterized protein n=1 Tax=Trifolium subterraneum TaxID=3900 RepID=A0A2Z6P3G6_TRISU|nr:hypothetical protein TSUD_226300 [Trifolium subterraneum]
MATNLKNKNYYPESRPFLFYKEPKNAETVIEYPVHLLRIFTRQGSYNLTITPNKTSLWMFTF